MKRKETFDSSSSFTLSRHLLGLLSPPRSVPLHSGKGAPLPAGEHWPGERRREAEVNRGQCRGWHEDRLRRSSAGHDGGEDLTVTKRCKEVWTIEEPIVMKLLDVPASRPDARGLGHSATARIERIARTEH